MSKSATETEVSEAAILARVFANGKRAMTAELARNVLGLTFSDEDKARMHDLAIRNQEGSLSAKERVELQVFIRAGYLLAILQSKARRALKNKP